MDLTRRGYPVCRAPYVGGLATHSQCGAPRLEVGDLSAALLVSGNGSPCCCGLPGDPLRCRRRRLCPPPCRRVGIL